MTTKPNDEKAGFVERVLTGLNDWKRVTEALEVSLVPNVAATAPWLAPILPAYMAYNGMVAVLGFWEPVAFAGGLTIEFVGVSTVATAVELWRYNEERRAASKARKIKSKKSSKKPVLRGLAPDSLAMGMVVVYYGVILTVNVLLDGGDVIHKIAKGLLSSLTIVAAVTVSLRWQHSQRLAEKAQGNEKRHRGKVERELLKEQLKLAESQANSQKDAAQVAERPETYGKWDRWPDLPDEKKVRVAEMVQAAKMGKKKAWKTELVSRLQSIYGIKERSAYQWIEYAERDYLALFSGAELQEVSA